MSKVLITLKVPAIKEQYDLFVPDFLTIEECITLLTEALSDMTQKQFVSSGKEVLLNYNNEEYKILEKEYRVSECGVQHGDTWYLF